ncbi:MAG TPA: CHAP domain-containing protein [Acidimicrobiales bacterium]|nr:CHAP domain-containing protein [Acidimicrobiales bacterium]
MRRPRAWVGTGVSAVAATVLLVTVVTVVGPSALRSARASAVTPLARFPGNGIGAYGDASKSGDFSGIALDAPATTLAPTPDGKGYWVAAADGGVFAFGDAGFYGSMGDKPLAAPVVAMAGTSDGQGYWMSAIDGGIFAFGDAPFYGSMGVKPLDAPVVGMAATHDGRGYWLVASDGGVFSYGDASFHGSASGADIGTWVVGMAPTHDDAGYWLLAATAGVLTFGDAAMYGPTPNNPPFSPAAAIAATPDGKGYWLLQPDEIDTTFSASPIGPAFAQGGQVVAVAASQIGPNPDLSRGSYCNPYGPCEQWCALFATWVWQQVGIGIPQYAFTGKVFDWGQTSGVVLPGSARPAPGDAILFGTGPQNASTSVHVGIVAETWPDGAVVTVEGDSGPEPDGQDVTSIDGPFLPADAGFQLGMPVYAFVRP